MAMPQFDQRASISGQMDTGRWRSIERQASFRLGGADGAGRRANQSAPERDAALGDGGIACNAKTSLISNSQFRSTKHVGLVRPAYVVLRYSNSQHSLSISEGSKAHTQRNWQFAPA